MALQWQVIDVPIDGIDRRSPHNASGDRDVQGGMFIRDGEIAPFLYQDKRESTDINIKYALSCFSDKDSVWFYDGGRLINEKNISYDSTNTYPTSNILSTGLLLADHSVGEPFGIGEGVGSIYGACINTVQVNGVSYSYFIISFMYSDFSGVDTFPHRDAYAFVSADTGKVLAVRRGFLTASSFGNFTPEDFDAATTPALEMRCVVLWTNPVSGATVTLFFKEKISIITVHKYSANPESVQIISPYEGFQSLFFGAATYHYDVYVDPESYAPSKIFAVCCAKRAGDPADGTSILISRVNNVASTAPNFTSSITTSNLSTDPTFVLVCPANTTINSTQLISCYHNTYNNYLFIVWTGYVHTGVYGDFIICGATVSIDPVTNVLTTISAPAILYTIAGSSAQTKCVGLSCVSSQPVSGSDSVTSQTFCVSIAKTPSASSIGEDYRPAYETFTFSYSAGVATTIATTNNVIVTSNSFFSGANNASVLKRDNLLQHWFGFYATNDAVNEFAECTLSYSSASNSASDGFARPTLEVSSVLGLGRTGSYGVSQIAKVGNRVLRGSALYKPAFGDEAETMSATYRFLDVGGPKSGKIIEYRNRSYLIGGSVFDISSQSIRSIAFFSPPTVAKIDTAAAGGGVFANNTDISIKLVYSLVGQSQPITLSAPASYTIRTPAAGGPWRVVITGLTPGNQKFPFGSIYVIAYIRNALSGAYLSAGSTQVALAVTSDNNYPSTYTITLTGAATGDAIYTDIGELPNTTVPAPMMPQLAYQDRIAIVDDFGNIFVSKPTNATRGVEFSDLLISPSPVQLSEIDGTGSIDNSLVVFSGKKIFSTSGYAPDSFGNGAFPPWASVQSNVRLLSHASILQSSEGIYFGTSTGLMFVTRGMQVVDVGTPISGYEKVVSSGSLGNLQILDNYMPSPGPITGSVFIDSYSYSLFSDSYSLYCYSETFKKWSRVILGNTGTFSSLAYSDEILYITRKNDSLLVFRPYASVATHATTSTISMVYDTGWVTIFGGNGYGRIRRLAMMFGDPGLNASVSSGTMVTAKVMYDFNEDLYDSITISSSDIAAYFGAITQNGSNAFSYNHRPSTQKMRSIRIRLTVNPNTQITLRGFALEAAAKSGVKKLAKEQVK